MPHPITRQPALTLAAVTIVAGLTLESLHALLGLGGHALDTFCDKDVYTAVEVIAVLMCAARVRRPSDRAVWALMTVALAAWTAGDLIWTLWLDNLSNPPYPSVADAVYLFEYPCMYAALMLLMRARLHQASVSQWLDGGVVGLTVAALACGLVLSSVIGISTGHLMADLVNLAYVCGDLSLLVFVAVAYALANWRPGTGWLILGSGVLVTAIADIVFLYQSANGTYVTGTILDVTWPASMALFVAAAWSRAPRANGEAVEAPHTILLTVLAAAFALALLVYAAFVHTTPLAVGLAAAALVLAAMRAALTYLENVRMLRRSAVEAMTDALSGLGNRRALMGDLGDAFADGCVHTLVFFDLNGFKRYNDSFGHAAGDALLARIGQALSLAVRGAGRAYRLGGDEFCALLDGRRSAPDPVVAAAAEALVERGSAFTIEAAVGVATVPDDAATASAALQLADERMYADKARTSRAQARDVLMQVLDERTPGLLAHVSSVASLVDGVGRSLGLEGEALEEALRAAELHDVGKLAIPDEILDKPGALDESEWRFMRQHPVIGERILTAAPALTPVAKLVRASHERYDGHGYPDGLAGEAIPLGARIVFACDAYDAMTSDRCYQKARTSAEALVELRAHSGTQFDPRVVEALCRYIEDDAERGGALAPRDVAASGGQLAPASA